MLKKNRKSFELITDAKHFDILIDGKYKQLHATALAAPNILLFSAGGLSPAETSFVNFMQEIVIMYIYLKYK